MDKRRVDVTGFQLFGPATAQGTLMAALNERSAAFLRRYQHRLLDAKTAALLRPNMPGRTKLDELRTKFQGPSSCNFPWRVFFAWRF